MERRSSRAPTFVVAFCLSLMLVMAPVSAFAGKKGGPSVSGATLAAPSSVGVGETFVVTGSGYNPSLQTWVKVETASSGGYLLARVDSAGNLTVSHAIWETGQASLTAYQSTSGRWRRVASTSTNVV